MSCGSGTTEPCTRVNKRGKSADRSDPNPTLLPTASISPGKWTAPCQTVRRSKQQPFQRSDHVGKNVKPRPLSTMQDHPPRPIPHVSRNPKNDTPKHELQVHQPQGNPHTRRHIRQAPHMSPTKKLALKLRPCRLSATESRPLPRQGYISNHAGSMTYRSFTRPHSPIHPRPHPRDPDATNCWILYAETDWQV